jgi:hypothetical protein
MVDARSFPFFFLFFWVLVGFLWWLGLWFGLGGFVFASYQ